MRWLRVARLCMPRAVDWCIAAGAVRTLVWNRLHGLPAQAHAPADVDLAYFDPADLSADSEAALNARLRAAAPDAAWEAVNQARVHLWQRPNGACPLPARSLAAALAAWPETATGVGVWMDEQDELRLVCPHGLSDLFGLVLRPSPCLVDPEVFAQRLQAKRYLDKWPRLRLARPE